MGLSTEKIYSILADRLAHFEPDGPLQPLEGGNLNHVWRLAGTDRSLIIKHAPPHIASNPDVPLSSSRIDFEAGALRLFEPSETLHELASDRVRPPRLFVHEPDHSLLVMEDIGEVPGLDSWLIKKPALSGIGEVLGRFIGRLHRTTYHIPALKDSFNNSDIQQTRNRVQYRPAADYAGEIDVSSNEVLRSRTTALGALLLQPGRCLVMGDLWPASILVQNGNLRLIDWEFVHYGRPLQDVGHFAAHCWMQAHTASSSRQAQQWKQLWLSFWEEYQETTGLLFPKLFNQEEFTYMTVHIGAEILVRAAGPFKTGYLYQDFPSTHPLIQEAVKSAVQITGSDISSIWNYPPATGS